ncbi:MAG: hypothetical protein GF416_04775 [Candidatus Altiarchaeales archaeon]|nr:hypothetical protein [Candidatus Altiarchaeales archaeon]MBD3416434.1 hypothetical protein [Candidatus Altiarchaeales archaeon]
MRMSIVLLVIMSGCLGGGPDVEAEPTTTTITLPEDCGLDVPVRLQMDGDWCGVAVSQMILEYYGLYADQKTLSEEIVGDRGGSLTHMKDVLAGYGLEVEEKNYGLEGVSELEKAVCGERSPVIVLQRMGFENPNSHYRIVAGFDRRYAYVIDPYYGRVRFTRNEFRELWEFNDPNRVDNTALIVRGGVRV